MNVRRVQRGRKGLILLVVLGMLSLLSLLAVSYVVFSSHSRNSSAALIRRDFRMTPHEKLLDDALRQILRGTTDPHSVAWKNDILGDLHGSDVTSATLITDARNDLPLFLTARYTDSSGVVLRDNPQRNQTGNEPYTTTLPAYGPGSPEGPQTFPVGVTPPQFLKIPIAWTTGSYTIASFPLPEQSDTWNGRVISFINGPLSGQSFRILRYVGEVDVVADPSSGNPVLDPEQAPLQYSITIDFSELLDQFVSVRNSSTGIVTSATVSDWLSTSPASLLYQSPTTFSNPYVFLVNAGPMNSNGLGLDLAGTSTPATTTNGNFSGLIPDAFLPNRAASIKFNSGYAPTGDTDEPWDAVDAQNFFLAMKQQSFGGSAGSDDIIPSFHRPAIINALIQHAPDLSAAAPTPQLFMDYLELVERATGRPVSYDIGIAMKNPDFSGSSGLAASFGGGLRSPQLKINWGLLPSAAEEANFQAWLRWMTRGPWDVDNDGDGIMDSVWTDLNYPLMTSPEGKLLKVLVAFYIEDMDSKLDINAAGNSSQVVDATSGQVMNSDKYAYRQANTANPGHWPQGPGYGAAEISLRPLFRTATEYNDFLQGTTGRYSSDASGDTVPGLTGNDLASAVLERNRLDLPSTYSAPPSRAGYPSSQFPLGVQGKSGFGLDLLGNPILVESGTISETLNDPYESRILFHSHGDRHFSYADYQRLIRFNDADRVSLPRRLQAIGSSFNPTTPGYFERIRSISPRNAALTLPTFPVNFSSPRYTSTNPSPNNISDQSRRVSSFIQFVEAYAKNKTPDIIATPPRRYFSSSALKRLFPIEFMQNRPLDLNRPLGDGLDNDGDGVIDEADEGPQNADGLDNDSDGFIDEADEGAKNAIYPTAPIVRDELVRDTSAELIARPSPAPNPYPLPTNYDPQLASASSILRNRYSGNEAKQLLARHLYCLAQLILPANHRFSNQPVPSAVPSVAERARILAQWAVNVVDFRDADSSCTRFAYDHKPFEPKPSGTVPLYWAPGFDPINDGVVWGMEQPEMLLSETMAFHNINVRVEPTSNPTNPAYQQLRVPQGSLFLEFLVPRTTSTAAAGDGTLPPATSELYTLDAGTLKLDLNKTVFNPDDPNPRHRVPVWRVALLKPVSNGTGYKDRLTEAYTDSDPRKRFRYSYQIGSEASGLKWDTFNDASILAPEIDRVLWFADVDPAVSNHGLPQIGAGAENRIFKFTAGRNVVAGGQYLVVGPRPVTYMGSKSPRQSPPVNTPSNHRFELVNGWLQIWNQENQPMLWAQGTPLPFQGALANNAVFADRIRDCVTMTAGMEVPADWMADPEITEKWIGLNISEPNRDRYYRIPDQYLNRTDTGNLDPDTNAPGFKDSSKDAYIDLLDNTGTPPRPLDNTPTAFLRENNFGGTTALDGHADIKTEENWSAAVLQRLADPSRVYHEVFNPYITVDWMTIDLTVFSGEERLAPQTGQTPPHEIKLFSRQKTGAVVLPELAVTSGNARSFGSTFYSYHTSTIAPSAPALSTGTPYFDYELPAELYTRPGGTPLQRSATANFSTFGYLNPTYVIRGTGPLQVPPVPATHDYQFAAYFKGVPGPNLWAGNGTDPLLLPRSLYFPNRDFVNAYELMNVPLSAPGQFMQEFVVDPRPNVPRTKFTLDFEDVSLPRPTPPARPAPGDERSTAILLECVGVRSPWADSWKLSHPAATQRLTTTPNEIYQTHLFENYRAPFNMLPTFREPGRINLNTISEPAVFRGLMWNMMTPTDFTSRSTAATVPFQASIIDSRRGYTTLTAPTPSRTILDPNPQLDPRAPSEFMHIFGSPLTPFNFAINDQMGATASSMTALREYAPGTRLLSGAEPGVFPATNIAGDNTFTFNYPVQRMANLVTNKSNVYSIRMTLGYFEYTPATPAIPGPPLIPSKAAAIGQEYGADQGRSIRHRAYYLIDRSIPVGYQPGHDHNTDKAILARSIIE